MREDAQDRECEREKSTLVPWGCAAACGEARAAGRGGRTGTHALHHPFLGQGVRPTPSSSSHASPLLNSEVARFCAAFMAAEVRSHAGFGHGPDRDVPGALIAAFHKMDEKLRSARPAPPSARLAATAAHLSPPPPATLLAGDEMEEEEEVIGAAASTTAAGPSASAGGDENRAPPAGAAAAPAEGGEAGPASEAAATAAPAPAPVPTPAATCASAAATIAAAAAARSQAGCTALVALLSGTDLWVANAGDSRAVLCGPTGVAVPLSSDHKPGEPGEAARIRAAGGFVAAVGGVARVNGSLALSRAIGDLAFKDPARAPPDQVITAQPDVRHYSLTPGDAFLLLACDGVWDVLSSQGAVDVVRKALESAPGNATAAAHALVDACLSPDPAVTRGAGCDNVTAAVVLLPTAEGGE